MRFHKYDKTEPELVGDPTLQPGQSLFDTGNIVKTSPRAVRKFAVKIPVLGFLKCNTPLTPSRC